MRRYPMDSLMSPITPTSASRRQALRLSLGAWGALALPGALAGAGNAAVAAAVTGSALALQWRERGLLALGTTVWLRAGHARAEVAERAIEDAVAAVQRVDQQMSLFRPDSELSRLNRDGHLHQPSAELRALLRQALHMARHSGGQFDPTVQPLWQLWQRAQAEGRRPGADELRQVRQRIGWQALQVSDAAVQFTKPGMALTLNGIAQGFAADQALAAVRAHGIAHALLDTGEWQPLGRADDAGPWRLGLADPHHADRLLGVLQADGRALACSSDDKLAFSPDRRDHHILDPRSGYSPSKLSTVVVAAPSATLADALTKPLFMGDLHQALALARRWGVDVLAVDKAGRMAVSPGLRLKAAA